MDRRPENSDQVSQAVLCRKRHNRCDGPQRAANRKHNALRAAGHLRLVE